MAAGRLPALAYIANPGMGQGRVSSGRLPGHCLLFRAQVKERRPQKPGRGRSRTATHLRKIGCAPARAGEACGGGGRRGIRFSVGRSEEHTSELQSLMRISYAVFCLKKKSIIC